MADIDIIFIAGDFFDRQLQLPMDDVYLIRKWITNFLHLCAKHDVVVRVLEGTPSHDWKQSKLFTHLNELGNIGADVEHVTSLSIEHIDRFGIDVLYIPDEWRPTCEQTWHEVVDLLSNKGLQQVDYVVMHGAFHHQMPKNLAHRLDLHNADNYLSICRKYIFVGHVHFMSQYIRILSAGSTDRLSHGEEGAKGYFRVTVRPDGNDEILFIENKLAKKYITIICDDLDETECRDKIMKAMRKLKHGACIRIRCKPNDIAVAIVAEYATKYTMFTWSEPKIVGNQKQENSPVLIDNRDQIKTLWITPDNVEKLLMERILNKHPQLAGRCQALLKELLSE